MSRCDCAPLAGRIVIPEDRPHQIVFQDPAPMTIQNREEATWSLRYHLGIWDQSRPTHQEAPMANQPIEQDAFAYGKQVRADALGRKHVGALIEFTDRDGVSVTDVVTAIYSTDTSPNVIVRLKQVEPMHANAYYASGRPPESVLLSTSFKVEPDADVWVRLPKKTKAAKA